MKRNREELARQITFDLIRKRLVHHSAFTVVSRLIRAYLEEAVCVEEKTDPLLGRVLD